MTNALLKVLISWSFTTDKDGAQKVRYDNSINRFSRHLCDRMPGGKRGQIIASIVSLIINIFYLPPWIYMELTWIPSADHVALSWLAGNS